MTEITESLLLEVSDLVKSFLIIFGNCDMLFALPLTTFGVKVLLRRQYSLVFESVSTPATSGSSEIETYEDGLERRVVSGEPRVQLKVIWSSSSSNSLSLLSLMLSLMEWSPVVEVEGRQCWKDIDRCICIFSCRSLK